MTASEPHPQTGQPVGLPVSRTTPAPRPGPVTLKGRYGRLEKLTAVHAADLWSVFAGHDQVWTYIATDGPFANAAEFSAFLQDPRGVRRPLCLRDRRLGRPRRRLRERFCGSCRSIGSSRSATCCIRRHCNARRSEPKLQYLLARYVFETLGYRRYEWKCDALNAASRRAALRYGFVYEGTFRQYMITKEGRNRDNAWFSMLDSEWPARKRNFERWLAPENFDSEGRQKLSLAALNGQKA